MERAYEQLKTAFTASGIRVYRWSNLANGDSGAPLQYPVSAGRSIQVEGDFGAGGRLEIQGCNSPELEGEKIWALLSDSRAPGLKLFFTAATGPGILQAEPSYFLRPIVVSGNSTTRLSVVVLILR